MLTLSSREKKMVLVMVLFISIVLMYRYFVIPYIERWNLITSQIRTLETRINQAKQLKSNPGLMVYAQGTILNQTDATAYFLENLESWASDAGVIMTSVRPGAIQNRGVHSELNYEVEITGDLETVCRFIAQIEQPSAIARINRIRIAKPKDLLKEITANITVATLSRAESAPKQKSTTTSGNNEL
ncbi:MAG: type 4a pilus biogenesis protein PilO [bacterium]|nr:type 4a pilus biogenesis protein PilO [bacterium]